MSLSARDYTREEAGLHLEFYQRDFTDECCHRGTSCRVVPKSFQGVAQKPENAAQPATGPTFHLSAWRTLTTVRGGGPC